MTLVLTGRNAEALTKITEACRAKGAAVIPKQIDVVNKHGMAHFIAEVDDRTPLDMVIANAGVTEETIGTRADLEASAYKVFETNVAGVFNTIFPALSGMQKRGSGQIVLMSSLAGNGAISGSAAYASSKAAVRIWGESARYQLARDGIAVNIVTPGYVASPMTQANKFQMSNVVTMDYAVKQITQGLAKNEALIAFPAATLIQTWFLGSLPSQIKDWIARNRLIGVISYWRRKPAAKKEAKKE